MKKVFLLSLLLLTGCGYLPSINPNATKSTTQSSKDTYEIRFEGKKGLKVKGIYSIGSKGFNNDPTRFEKVEGVLPFSVKLELPSNVSVGATLSTSEQDANPKVFISKNGKECGKAVITGNAVPDLESSKACISE